MMYCKSTIYIILWGLLIPHFLLGFVDEPYHDSAFMGPKNTFYGLTYYSRYHTDHFFNKHGKRLKAYNKLTQDAYRLDMEYAISSKNSIYLKGGYARAKESLNGNSQGVEDTTLGFQQALITKPKSAFAVKINALIPVGRKKSAIRYGCFGVEGMLLYSKIFDGFQNRLWTDLTASYLAYSSFPSDQVRLSASFGLKITNYIYLISSTKLYCGLFNGHERHNQNYLSYNPNYRLLTTQVQGIIQLHEFFSITLGGFLHLWGQNYGTGGGFYSGVWLIF